MSRNKRYRGAARRPRLGTELRTDLSVANRLEPYGSDPERPLPCLPDPDRAVQDDLARSQQLNEPEMTFDEPNTVPEKVPALRPALILTVPMIA
jgi:hypothetical protein